MFGAQSIGVLIQFKKVGSNFEVFAESGRERTGIFLLDWISKIQSNGAGEIFLCSIDNDGVDDDINYEILEKASNICFPSLKKTKQLIVPNKKDVIQCK